MTAPAGQDGGADMTITEDARIVVAYDADGGLRISPTGALAGAVVVCLNDTVVAGLRAAAPRVEIDLRSVTACDADAIRVLEAGRRIARHIGIELRITGGSGLGIDVV